MAKKTTKPDDEYVILHDGWYRGARASAGDPVKLAPELAREDLKQGRIARPDDAKKILAARKEAGAGS